MRKTLYVANLAPAVTTGQLRELFGQYGDVSAVEFHTEDKTGIRYALVTMAVEKAATKASHGLNGHLLEDKHLAISYPDVDLNRHMTNRQRKAAQEIAAALGESEEKPLRQIKAIVHLCGTGFAQAILAEVDEVEAQGGLMTKDGERRTRGGVFFYLARYRMARPARRIVYNRKGRLPTPEAAPEEPTEAEKEA